MLRPFRLIEPGTVPEACAELGRLGEGAKVYAGGAELILLLRHGVVEADYLVDIKRLPGLTELRLDGDTAHIGAAVTHRTLENSLLMRERFPVLADAESDIGNIRVRTQGTLGGNLCFADPHSDPPTALLVYEALATVADGKGTRTLPIDEFLVGTYETILAPDELLVGVTVPSLPSGWHGSFQRLEHFYRPTVNAAAAVAMADGHVAEARLAVGCVGPRALRLPRLESSLRGLTVEEAERAIDGSKGYLEETLEPVEDLLGSVPYKLHLTTVLLRRGLVQAAGKERGDG
jgi:carbon-monoxide dehydrogenase medium subunit